LVDDNKIYRCSFSKSLLDFIVTNYYPNYRVTRYRYHLGKVLQSGETSRGLYAIMSSKNNIVLRIAMTKELAEMLTCDDSRYIQEVFLEIEV
jgi:hypothetical protein